MIVVILAFFLREEECPAVGDRKRSVIRTSKIPDFMLFGFAHCVRCTAFP